MTLDAEMLEMDGGVVSDAGAVFFEPQPERLTTNASDRKTTRSECLMRSFNRNASVFVWSSRSLGVIMAERGGKCQSRSSYIYLCLMALPTLPSIQK